MGKRPRMAIWKEIKTGTGRRKRICEMKYHDDAVLYCSVGSTTVLYDCQGRELTGSPTHKPLDCYVHRRRQVTERHLQYILYRCMLHF